MKNEEIKIFIIGGFRAFSVYNSLCKEYKQVYYFKNEEAYAKRSEAHPNVLIIEDSKKSIGILNDLKSNGHIHTIYFSNNINFKHVFRIMRTGVTDYILRDSCLCYSIHQSVKKLRGLSKDERVFIDSCELKKRFRLKFKMINLLLA